LIAGIGKAVFFHDLFRADHQAGIGMRAANLLLHLCRDLGFAQIRNAFHFGRGNVVRHRPEQPRILEQRRDLH